MLDIQDMIKSNDFSDLIDSTQEEREKSGGNYYLFDQLADYLYIDYIKQVVMLTFKDDEKIVEQMKEYDEGKETESLEFKECDSGSYDSIILP